MRNKDLESKLTFKQAIESNERIGENTPLDLSTEYHQFARESYNFNGEKTTGKELLKNYIKTNPSDKEYSNSAQLNRMFTECEVPQARFNDQETLRQYLLAYQPKEQWEKTEVSQTAFAKLQFSPKNMRSLSGQSLQNKFSMDKKNEQDGTFYRLPDYQKHTTLFTENPYICSMDGLRALFQTAGITAKTEQITNTQINPIKLREILLSAKTPSEWATTTSDEFKTQIFDVPRIKYFTGISLMNAYQTASINQIFKDAKINVDLQAQRRDETGTQYQQRMANIFANPHQLKKSLLEFMSEEDWQKAVDFQDIRLRKINLPEGEKSLHLFMQEYAVYEDNLKNPDRNPISHAQAQKTSEYSTIPKSSREVMDKICAIAQIQNNWRDCFANHNLHDKAYLNKLLSNATLEGEPITPEEITQLDSMWRKVQINDPETSMQRSLRSLVQLHSAYDIWKNEYPDESLNHVAIDRHVGKIGRKQLDNLLKEARII